MENPMPTTEEFPYVFNTGRGSVGQWHTQSRTKEVKFVEDVSLYSANGQNAEFAVKITDHVREDELYAPIHYIECNKLTPSIYDSYSKEPSYKSAAVRFEKR